MKKLLFWALAFVAMAACAPKEAAPVKKDMCVQMYSARSILNKDNYADVLAPGERGGKMTYIEGVPQNVFAFSRVKDGHEIRVYANLSITPTEVSLPAGYQNAMSGRDVDSSTSVLAPWSFVILGK